MATDANVIGSNGCTPNSIAPISRPTAIDNVSPMRAPIVITGTALTTTQADRRSPLHVAADERFVDNADADIVGTVAAVEPPPGHDREIERREVAGAHDLRVSRRPPVFWRWSIAHDLEEKGTLIGTSQWSVVAHATSRTPGSALTSCATAS
jgi:hypothetical protein